MKPQLRQEEIDEYFNQTKGAPVSEAAQSIPFDFRRLDRIPKAQLNALHFLHEHFIRGLTSSLSVYLRSYVSGNLVSVEQMQYADFADSLPSPTCMVYLSMQPYDGYCLAEINQSLLAPVVDLILGGTGKIKTDPTREITDVEKDILEGLFRVIAHNLVETWKQVVPVNFAVDYVETKPQLSRRITRNEAVVAITMELRVAEAVGLVNLAIPSLTLKMMRPRFDQQWAVHKSPCEETERAIKQRLANDLEMTVACELHGARISLTDLVNVRVHDVIDLGMHSPLTITVNGVPKFRGYLTESNSKVAATIEGVTSYANGSK
jgi:flagellar motor switch protein FliM